MYQMMKNAIPNENSTLVQVISICIVNDS